MGQEKDEGWDMVYLENEKLKVAIQEKGAELTSIVKKGDTDGISVECGSGILEKACAGIISDCRGGKREILIDMTGKNTRSKKHGFARDMEFYCGKMLRIPKRGSDWMLRKRQKKKFPFAFRL